MPTRRQCANAIRVLSIDAIEQAQSGHPGAPLGMADMAEALWRHMLKHNPANPAWVDRDRFVLSNGHASMLLYAALHLTGYDLSVEDITHFRQWNSRTPGHPERGVCPGVEMTTGPLGQGIASAVGMALAERLLAARFNTQRHTVVDHRTYVFCGDGCLMEGISHEACALAGVWKLGKLIALYDANGISIDGAIDAWCNEDVGARFAAYHWQVIGPVDGHNAAALDEALARARADASRPSLIICRTHIGFNSPKVDSAACHGAPLGKKAVAETRKALGWEHAPFVIPDDVYAAWDARSTGRNAESAWNTAFEAYRQEHPELAVEFLRRQRGDLPVNWPDIVQTLLQDVQDARESVATRTASRHVLDHLTSCLPELIGGSADLTGSVCTFAQGSENFNAETYTGNHISYGVREFGMSAVMNGLALHGAFIPYAGTFLSFADQAKNALRLAALMGIRVVWVLTHDSIGVGEDGPTHQPIEQLAMLRATPNFLLWRPCDALETAVAWKCAMESRAKPVCLALSRQKVPFFERTAAQVEAVARGGYVLRECDGIPPDLLLLATGSEVHLAVRAAEKLAESGCRARIVSMPCAELFDAQDSAYRESVLPTRVRARLAVEAAAPDYWRKYVGLDGTVVGMPHFGASAPAKDLYARFGLTVDNLVAEALRLLNT
ncbi:MAG: transketolase [Candidatus Desulfovibrio kirbyi]|uniref:Transketolase n=1 Tax=Candidatus Desulfovibrio kirbyi TaxID=2696086 RepID=A0A6L2R6R3_9BACT|nr:MAG: transketolase [Candidatus Desulfovibrio kirbyi]